MGCYGVSTLKKCIKYNFTYENKTKSIVFMIWTSESQLLVYFY